MTDYEKNQNLKDRLITRKVYCGLGDINEVNSASYKRVPVSFTTPVNGQMQNSVDIEFPIANEMWGKISKISLWDAPTGGNKLWEANAEVVKDIGIASQYKIPRGYMIIRLR